MIAIIDYGMGNLRSVEKALQQMGFDAQVTDNPQQVLAAKGVVLPGVGAFADAMANLNTSGMIPAIEKTVEENKPFVGICLGLQLMFSYSEENGLHSGLGIFPGKVVKIPAGLKVPHMGWNQINIKRENPILKDVPNGSNVYFVHSYYVEPEDKEIVVSTTDYSLDFTSIVAKGNTFGIQFHPEKSSKIGLKILQNFGEIAMGR